MSEKNRSLRKLKNISGSSHQSMMLLRFNFYKVFGKLLIVFITFFSEGQMQNLI